MLFVPRTPMKEKKFFLNIRAKIFGIFCSNGKLFNFSILTINSVTVMIEIIPSTMILLVHHQILWSILMWAWARIQLIQIFSLHQMLRKHRFSLIQIGFNAEQNYAIEGPFHISSIIASNGHERTKKQQKHNREKSVRSRINLHFMLNK